MPTNNYDILVQLHEKALNKALAMVFYNEYIKLEGFYHLSDKLPDSVKSFTSFKYKISLSKEPFVDFRGQDTLFLRFAALLKFTVLSGLELNFNMDFYVISKICFDINTKKIYYNIQGAEIVKIEAQSYYNIGKEFINKLNFIIKEILNEYFKNQVKEIEIPIAINGLKLPMMPQGDVYSLPISNFDVKIIDNQVLTVGISFFNKKGSLLNVKNNTNNKDCYIAIDNQAAYNILDFWWSNTTYDKKQEFGETIEIGFATPLAKGVDSATRLISLGFIQTETDYENLMLNYDGQISLNNKPQVNIKENNLVEVLNLEFTADVSANVYTDVKKHIALDTSSFISDNITPWQDDIDIANINKNKSLVKVKNKFTLQINNAEGKLKINDKNNLAIKITKADFKLLFNKKGTTFSDNTWNKIMEFLKDKVLEKIPEIVISPSLILADLNIFGFSLNLSELNLTTTDKDLVLSTNVNINELVSDKVAVPNYIGNKATKVIHMFHCKGVRDIDTKNRVGYYVMYEALSENYSPCKNCLSSYNIK
ncbi:MAG: hypothetical protein ACOYEG_07350 [Petrimonas sp.]|jgi:hypothetical protein